MRAEVLDLFSAAAGGWSLGMHRAGFTTIAACEVIDWRRALYSHNNPGVRIYDDVRTLTAARLLDDLGRLPRIVVGSPPCQDISSANTKGKGVEGERSGLYFEAVRLIGEIRPRWFALENSANLRTRGADAVLGAMERLGYACWAFVVSAEDCGANHERKRCWLIGCDVEQVANPDGDGRDEGWCRGWCGIDISVSSSAADSHSDPLRITKLSERPKPEAAFAGDASRDASQDGCGSRLSRRRAGADTGAEQPTCGNAEHATSIGYESGRSWRHGADGDGPAPVATCGRNTPDPDQARQAHGCMEFGVRQAEITDDGCGAGRSDDGSCTGQMGICAGDRGTADRGWADWSLADLAARLRIDDGLSAELAGTRIEVGDGKRQSAASLIVEAFGDAVIPQIPEAIGRAILRTEAAMRAVIA